MTCASGGRSGGWTHPGLLAPASLKLPPGWTPSVGHRRSSGASCPGLIEAETQKDQQAAAWETHPGLLAPASLKHPLPNAMVSNLHSHPGLLAPASLKHISNVPRSAAQCSSGASCPGLIEAIRNGEDDRDIRTHPGLLAPASLKLKFIHS